MINEDRADEKSKCNMELLDNQANSMISKEYCLLVLKEGRPTGTISLQKGDSFENETAS